MKILTKTSVTKRVEYSQSYGGAETIECAFIKEFDKEIQMVSQTGNHIRTFKKGTKLLISFKGVEITERQFSLRVKKAKKVAESSALIQNKINSDKLAERNAAAAMQLGAWKQLLIENPDKAAKYISKMANMASSKWRNLLRLKAAKHVNNGPFEGLEVTASELRDVLISLPS